MFLMLLYYLLTLKHYFQCESRHRKTLKYLLKSANYSVIILMLGMVLFLVGFFWLGFFFRGTLLQ